MAGPDRPHMQHSQRKLTAVSAPAAQTHSSQPDRRGITSQRRGHRLCRVPSRSIHDCTHTASQGENATARLTAGPGAASGTFNPLCKVLCILQSLYFCASGPTLVFHLVMDTHHSSNCSPKPLYSWIPAAAQRRPWRTQGVRDNIPLVWTIPGRFLAPRPPTTQPPTPEPTASDETHSSRPLLPRQCSWGISFRLSHE